jgi:hypothetical protein
MDYLVHGLIIGIGATAVMDVWGWLRGMLFGLPRLDYALLGRWFGHMTSGQFSHQAIADAAPVRGERLAGWIMHYLIGCTFALLLLRTWGLEWLDRPAIVPALIVGLSTVVAPLLIMQPAMGAGIAASKSANPASARLQSLVTHTIYGLGLFVSGWLDHLLLAN